MRLHKEPWIVIPIGFIWSIITLCIFDHLKNIPKGTNEYEAWLFCVYSITAFFIFWSCFLLYLSMVEASDQRDKDKEFSRKENAFKLLDRWQSELLIKSRKHIHECYENEVNLSGLHDCEYHHEHCEHAVILFNFFEVLYISIMEKYADKKILKNAFQDAFKNCYDICKPWIKSYLSEKSPNTSDNIKKLYMKWNS